MLTAYAPLAQGKVNTSDELRDIADKYGKTAAQIALRWLIEQGNVVAIPKASSKDHIEQNIDILHFYLEDEDFNHIDQLDNSERLVNARFAPKWDYMLDSESVNLKRYYHQKGVPFSFNSGPCQRFLITFAVNLYPIYFILCITGSNAGVVLNGLTHIMDFDI